MSKKNLKCQNCGKVLKGRQRKFCSIKCKNKRKVDDKVNNKQEKFCQLFATDKEFFGNGVESYIEAYNLIVINKKEYLVACASASRLLSNVKVCERINEILESCGFNDPFVDKQLAFLFTQHSDFKTKLGAIKEYNKLKKRVVDKIELTRPFKDLTDEELQEYIEENAKMLNKS